MEKPHRAVTHAGVRDLHLSLLGAVFCVAFLSLYAQIGLLLGSDGLLPAAQYLSRFDGPLPWRWLDAPTIFWLGCSDWLLEAATLLGAGVSVLLVLRIAPRYSLIVLWGLYLSLVTVGQEFLSFQWDNLLLETAFFSLFIAPGGIRRRTAPAPHWAGVFLMQWLLIRLHVESGAAKLLAGDPTWRDLTAMVSYYETAPLPTWLGWYAHQWPLWAHQATALLTFFIELIVPWCVFAPRLLRAPAFLLMFGLQVVVILTANYGFFNYLSALLCLWMLDDGHLDSVRRLLWLGPRSRVPPARPWWPTPPLVAAAALLVLISIVPFLPFLVGSIPSQLTPLRRVLGGIRSINAYHLFATMTLVRREAVIEGSSDGQTWLPYEFRYKPGDPLRAPGFVAPYQPRVDFLMWFLLLGRRDAPYFDTLLRKMQHKPEAVAPLFAINPFPGEPPAKLRVAIYHYTFTDAATRAPTGLWWNRELLGYSRVVGG